METRNSRKMRGESVPVLANNTGDAEPAAESQSTQHLAAQQPITPRPAAKPRLTEQDIVGLKYFDELLPLFRRLRDDGCQRDKAGNRELHYDQYCLLVLLYLGFSAIRVDWILITTGCCGSYILRGVVRESFGVTFRGDKDVEREGVDVGVESVGI